MSVVRRLTGSLMLASVFYGCDADYAGVRNPTRIHVQGAVTNAQTAEPLTHAVVELHAIGWTSAVIVSRVNVDVDGRYEVIHVDQETLDCSFLLRAMADGYVAHERWSSQGGVQCTSSTQHIDLPLDPAP